MWADLERPPLCADTLRRTLVVPAGPYAALDVVTSVTSTNTVLVAAARSGVPDRTVLVAEYQTEGRGRAARSWVAPPRSGLIVSILLRPHEVAQARWGWLPLLAGVAVCRTVVELGAVPAMLKWPNDLLLGTGGRKAGGILAEAVPGPAVVLGIGLNVTLRPEELPWSAQARSLVTSLDLEQAACTDRHLLLRALLQNLHREVLAWCAQAGDPDAGGLRDSYRKYCATLGERVRVELPGQPALTGTAVDLDATGRLVVRSGEQRHALAAGDVTHLRAVDSS